ncbi:MAG: PD40 domain-containing protein [Candidatus Zixiibacteriota bacterium]|nr:MAG: PD40 domain-containing protein [candidate division Zixibacteria bacterium]
MKIRVLLVTLTMLTTAGHAAGDDQTAQPAGAYLGQTPPGLIPKLFAPGVISTSDHRERDVTFSSGLDEFYFTRDATIMVMKLKDGQWTTARPASFSADYYEFEACLSPDGRRLYYISNRSLSGQGEPERYQMWMVARQGTAWGEPQRLTDRGDFYASITRKGRMYFTSAENDLYRTKLVDGVMSVREKLGDSVNTASDEYNCCIAPDESYLVFTSLGWGEGFGGGDLWICFRKPDGSWSRPKNMGGGINSGAHEYCPAVSPDGKYLFFASNINGADDIFWVDAAIVERLKSEDLDLADMLFDAVVGDGIQAGLEKYAGLKARYADLCIFDGRLLSSVADRLIRSDEPAPASTLIMQSFRLYPQTMTLEQTLKLAVISGDSASFGKISDELRQAGSTFTTEDEAVINRLGYRFLAWGRVDDAVRILELNVALFPNSANTYDSYGEALLGKGDTVGAVENYKKSLELNPENTNAVRVLKNLGIE